MDRRTPRIRLILLFTALAIGLLPVIPVGEVLAPGPSVALTAPAAVSETAISPVADATVIQKLRHLFSH